MKRRLIALCLAAVLVFSLAATVSAEDLMRRAGEQRPATKASAMEDGYVYACAQSVEPCFVQGATAELSFKRRVATPSSGDIFFMEIYRGTADQLLAHQSLTLMDKRSYSISQFKAPNYTLTTTVKLDSRYSAGTYAVRYGIRNSAGNQYSGDYYYVMDMFVKSREIPATGISCYIVKGPDSGLIDVGQTLVLRPALDPDDTTTARNFKVSSSVPNVASVTVDAGFIYVYGKAVGIADIVIRCGNLEESFPIGVGELYDLSISQGRTSLCVGNTDTIRYNANADSGNVYIDWKSSNPSVATVNNGVVTGVGPGTVTITASCYGLTRSATYTVDYHQFPAGTVIHEATATKPRYSEGYCSVCGKANCINIYAPAIFTDTASNAWYSDHVDAVYRRGLMNGTGEHTFAPNSPVTRGMVVTVLYRISGQPTVSGVSSFPDVPAGKYYSNAVIWAQNLGIVTGFNDGKYHPDENVTREQLATIIYRFAQTKGQQMDSLANLNSFPDVGSVHNYAKTALSWAVAEGIITGVGKDGRSYLQPASSATRAQFATIISRFLESSGILG